MKRKKDKKVISRFFAVLLTLAMVLTLMPASALAAGGTGSGDSGVVVTKTATLEDDGTYTINLSAYATGTTTTVTEKSGVPLDIVLVIDQSGSMAYNDAGNSTNTPSDRRVYKLKEAVTGFVNNIAANGREYNVDHRIAMVGFASERTGDPKTITGSIVSSGSDSTYWLNTGLFVNGYLKNYGTRYGDNLTATDYKNSLVSVNTKDDEGNITDASVVNDDITTSIGNIGAYGATYTEYGLTMAQKVFDNNPIEQSSNRKRIVVLFTDGATNSSVNTVLTTANTLKGSNYNTTIYCVGFGSSVDDDFLDHVSSNYTTASYSWRGYSGTSVATKYSMTANNREELNKIFTNISEDIQNPSTDVTLNASSVMRDILGSGFVLPTGYASSANIAIQTQAGTADESGNITWGGITNSPEGITATANTETGTVDITGFNYSEKYIANTHPGEKLMVTIKGIEATDAAITNADIDTNNEKSGIYASASEAEPAVVFPQPKTLLTSKSYVLDYGKKVNLTSSDWSQNSVTSLNENMHKFTAAGTQLSKTYGTVEKSNATTLSYSPQKINWDGYDSFYAFGKKTDDTNIWSKINVIPATSVYYEDDFLSSVESTDAGVKIQYAGNWSTVSDNTEAPADDDTQSSSNGRYGYDANNDNANDVKYSNGSAHFIEGAGKTSTATFTFTGTGVDIYSRTDMQTGLVRARLYKGTSVDDEDALVAVPDVDQLWTQENELYQIPTLFFKNLEYGTYTVKIMVADGNTTGGRKHYYLDGIRVYEPIKQLEATDNVVSGAYDSADESNSLVQTVRSILLDAKSVTAETIADGAVFIDYLSGSKAEIGTYETYGPKNEVYLEGGKAIAFHINADRGSKSKVYVGLKAPEGNGATIIVTNGNGTEIAQIKSASDLYYEVTPNDNGNVIIKNEGSSLLAVTNVRVTKVEVSTASLQYTPQVLSDVSNFDKQNSLEVTETTKNAMNKVEISQAGTSEDNTVSVEEVVWSSLKTSAAKWLSRQ